MRGLQLSRSQEESQLDLGNLPKPMTTKTAMACSNGPNLTRGLGFSSFLLDMTGTLDTLGRVVE